MDRNELCRVLEAVLLAEDQPLTVDRLVTLFESMEEPPEKAEIREALKQLDERLVDTAMELRQVATGWRLQVRQQYAGWVSRLWREKPTRYSRAFLETLALIVYRQPITRSEIEEVRGVSVSSNIIRNLTERGWIREVGQREVPGRPTLLGTTKQFLDDFDLRSLDALPSLPEIKDLDALHAALEKLAPGSITPEELKELAGDDDANMELELGRSDAANSDSASAESPESTEPAEAEAADDNHSGPDEIHPGDTDQDEVNADSEDDSESAGDGAPAEVSRV